MATHRSLILGWATSPDISGNVYTTTDDVFATNDKWDRLVTVFLDSGTRIGLDGGFTIPKNYVGTPLLVVVWTSTATAGNVVWDCDYRAVGGDDAESLDQGTAQESLTVTDAAPTAANNRLETSMALTASNLAVDDNVSFTLFRDGTDAADTMAGSVRLYELYFQYNDA